MERTLALATCRDLPRSCPDDAHLLQALASAGVPHETVPWDAPGHDWTRHAGVLIRATWDYYLRPAAFLGWVGGLEAAGVPLWNPAPVVRWNHDKRYLADLAKAGVPVVPTRFLARGDKADLGALLEEEGWERAVLKPVVSAGAHRTVAPGPGPSGVERGQAHLEALLAEGDAMVQPFVPEVAERGEWSLIFLGGAFSHAVLKRAGRGDFRVQEKHGGSLAAAASSPEQVRQARAVLDAAPGGPLPYARVDMVEAGGRLVLMELEVLEPELFFRTAPGSAGRLVAALPLR